MRVAALILALAGLSCSSPSPRTDSGLADAVRDATDDAGPAVPCSDNASFQIIGRLAVWAPLALQDALPAGETTAFRAGTSVMVDGNWIPRQHRDKAGALAVVTCVAGQLQEVSSQAVRLGLTESDPFLFFELARDIAASGDGRTDRNYFLALRRRALPPGPPHFVLSHHDFSTSPALSGPRPFSEQAPGWQVQKRGCKQCGAYVAGEGFFGPQSLQLCCSDCAGTGSGVSVVSPPIPTTGVGTDYLQLYSALGLLSSWTCGEGRCTECDAGREGCTALGKASEASVHLRFVDAGGQTIARSLVRMDREDSKGYARFRFPVANAQYAGFNHDKAAFLALPPGATAVQIELGIAGGPACAEFDDLVLLRRNRPATDHIVAAAISHEPTVEHEGGLKIKPKSRARLDEVLEHGFQVTAATRLIFEDRGEESDPRHARALRLAADFVQQSSTTVFGGALPEEQAASDAKLAGPFILLGEKDSPLVQAHLEGKQVPTEGLDGEEGYLILVRPTRIVVAGSGPRGLAYGAAALAEIFPLERAVAAPAPFFIRLQDIADQPDRRIRAVMARASAAELQSAGWSSTLKDGFRLFFRQALRARMNAILLAGTDAFAQDPTSAGYANLLELLQLCADEFLLELIPAPFNPRGTIDYRQDPDPQHNVFVAAGRRSGRVKIKLRSLEPGETTEFIEIDLPFVDDGYRKRWPLTAQEVQQQPGNNYVVDGTKRKVKNLDDGGWYVYADCAGAPCLTAPVLTGQCPLDKSGAHAWYCWDQDPAKRRASTVEVEDASGFLRLKEHHPADYDYELVGLSTTALRRLRPMKLRIRSAWAGKNIWVQYSYAAAASYMSSCLSEPEVYRRIAEITGALASGSQRPIRYLHIGMDELASLGGDLRDLRNPGCHNGPCLDAGEVLDYGVRQIRATVGPIFGQAPPTLMMWGDMVMKLEKRLGAGKGPGGYLPVEVWMVPWHYHIGLGSKQYIQQNVATLGAYGLTVLGGPHLGSSSNFHLWMRPYANVRMWAEALAASGSSGHAVSGIVANKFEPEGTGRGRDLSPLIIEGALAWRVF